MIWFYLALFWLLSISWIIYFYYKPLTTKNSEQTNTTLAKEKISQLELDLKTGLLSQSSFDDAKNDVLKMLTLDEEGHEEQVPNNKNTNNVINIKKSIIILSLISVFSFLILFITYSQLGDPENSQQIVKNNQQPTVESLLIKLKQHIEKEPNDIKALTILGKTYFSLQQVVKAKNTFAKAYQLAPKNEEVILMYASSIAAVNDNSLLGKPASLIKEILEINPKNIQALWLAGYLAYQVGNYSLAKKTWEQTLSLMSDSDPDRILTQQYLKDIKILQQEQNAKEKITVSVSIAKDLKIDKNYFVMIYARAPTGARMPIAIKKIRVGNLPITVILTDADSPMPTNKLSQVKEVIVFVRVSKTGQAIQQKDDIVVQSSVVNPQNKPEISLEIK